MKKICLYILTILIILKIQVFSVGCANMLPPSGGYRDSIPPVLVRATPADSSINFKDNHITLTFDEFIQLDNVRENLIVSPLPKRDPEVESKLRSVIIRLKDTLQPNTTYTLNFGKAIKDVNEGNIARNFTYMFSTGTRFDSLTLSGNVITAQTGQPDSTLVVMLYQSGDDSAVVNEKPRYLTRLDSSGNFNFRHLPWGTFHIYAMDDQGGGHRYTSDKQSFAFADSAVVLQAVNKPVTLYAYAASAEISPLHAATSTTPKSVSKQKGAANEKRLKLQTNVKNGMMDLLDSLVFTSEVPLKKLDTSLIHFSRDSTFTPISNYTIERDTSNKHFSFLYKWQENTWYHVILDKDFAQDTLGLELLKTDTISFKTKKLSDYGSLTLRFRGLDLSVHPVLLFVANRNVVKSVPLTSGTFVQDIFVPGDYELRILHDRNKNGKWDPGEFFGKHIQPEIVVPVKSRAKISVKADWQNEFDIQL